MVLSMAPFHCERNAMPEYENVQSGISMVMAMGVNSRDNNSSKDRLATNMLS